MSETAEANKKYWKYVYTSHSCHVLFVLYAIRVVRLVGWLGFAYGLPITWLSLALSLPITLVALRRFELLPSTRSSFLDHVPGKNLKSVLPFPIPLSFLARSSASHLAGCYARGRSKRFAFGARFLAFRFLLSTVHAIF